MLTKIKSVLPIILILCLALFFRAYHIGSYPSLNPDEAAIGYDAYSLLLTGKDEHGASWPIHFKSFGDYKPGGYFYLVMPFVKLLGLTPLAVRLPNLILSVTSVYFIYLLVKLLSGRKYLALSVAFVLAVNPWHIHFSRGGWESDAALSLIIIGTYFFFKYLKTSRLSYFFYFVLCFVYSLYTYHSARLIAPLLVFSLVFIYSKHLFSDYKKLLLPVFIGILLCIPVVFSFLHNGGTARFGGVGLTADQGPVWRANELLNQHGNVKLFNRVIHNKRLLYVISWAQKYSSHFDFNYLFLNGDEVPRSKVPEMGQFYLIELPLLLFGLFVLLRRDYFDKKVRTFIIAWILIAPVASSLTFQAPSALRSLPLTVPFCILIGLGLFELINLIQKKYFLIGLIGLFYIFSITYYFDAYFNHYQKRLPYSWNYGFSELVDYVAPIKSNYRDIYVTDKYDQPYILFLFFSRYNPVSIQQEIKLTQPDQYGFSTVRSFSNYHFGKIDSFNISPNSLIIASDTDNFPGLPQKVINFPNGLPAFKIYTR
ncbi:MAG TPA: glycosyltransferase family 39 protein [Patescibacteria group bacterium]